MSCSGSLFGSCGCGCAGVGALAVGAVSFDEMNELNTAVVAMNVDVNAAVDRAFTECVDVDLLGFCSDPKFELLRNFQANWTDFSGRWAEWFADHQTAPSRLGVDPEFAAFRNEYNQKRAQFIALGESTDAPDVQGSASAIEKGLAGLGTVAQVGLIGGGLLLLAYLAAPLVAQTLRSSR